jgi:hypothetical protein
VVIGKDGCSSSQSEDSSAECSFERAKGRHYATKVLPERGRMSMRREPLLQLVSVNEAWP